MNLSLKRPIISSSLILLLALTFPVFAQQDGNGGARSFAQSPYQVGERLTYNVSFSNFPSAAHAEFHIVSRGMHHGREAIELRAHVETVGVVNVALLAINNDYSTFIDPATGLPFRSEQTARDAVRSEDVVHDYNQPAGNEAIPPKQKGFPGTYDLLSAFYRARALPLAQGGRYSFTVRGEAVEYSVEVEVEGRQNIITNVGTFNAIETEVHVSNSPLRNLRIYFSDDESHVPVLITARVATGDLRAEIAASEIIKPVITPAPAPQIAVTPGPIPAPVAPAPAAPAPNGQWPFTIGEQLNYQIFIGPNTTPMGIATFLVKGRSRYFERDGLYLTVNAQTTNPMSRIFTARDTIESYVDPQALFPFRTVMNLIEGPRRLNQTLSISQESGTAVIADKSTRIEIPVGTHDYVSFFYAVRTLNLTPNSKSVVSMLVENKPKTLFITSLKRETIQLGERAIPAIALSIVTDDPEPDKYQLRMWISDDRRRLPLRVACTTKLGPLRADLAILPAASQ